MGALRPLAAMLASVAGCAEATPGPASGGDGGDGSDGGNTTMICGDGDLDAGEACDDGDDIDTNACTSSCTGWQYRVAITFQAPGASGARSIAIALDAMSFTYAHAASDGADLRFSMSETGGSLEVPYWIESWTPSGASVIWARVPSVAAGANTLHAFYGHSVGVATASDFAATFPNALRTTGNTTLGGAQTRDAFVVEAGHIVTVTAGAPLSIDAAYVRIDGTINANNAGYGPAAGPGPGGASTNAGAGGGGHGGAGGAGGHDSGDAPGAGGGANGIASAEANDMGSGGGSTDVSTGGRGGGAVTIDAQRAIVAGTITARGENGPGSARSAGGGAGGGVMVRASSTVFTGSIAVDGGTGGSGTSTVNDGGGGGGGGRIKLLHAGAIVDTGASTLTGGAGGLYGDTTNGRPGNPGTKHVGTSATLPALPAIGPEQHN